MTQEVAGPAADLQDDWFEKELRSLADVRFRLERKQRELDIRETELEAKARDMQEKGDRLREAFRTAQETSQDLMARSHRLREQQAQLAISQTALEREGEALAVARRDLERRANDLKSRESTLAEEEQRLRKQGTKSPPTIATAAPPSSPPEATEGSAVLERLLMLKAELEATIARVRSREGEAQSLLAEAGERASQFHAIEERVREQQQRLEGTRMEIVNAKRALLTVDQALLHMPYEVVDVFTKTAEFEEYERALRVLKRFEESPGRGS